MRILLHQAADLLKSGNVVAVPTETVYGLAASLQDLTAVQHIFKLKGRPSSNPLIVHVCDVSTLDPYIDKAPPFFYELAKQFWPGPLTLILPIKEKTIFPLVRASLPTAGFRIPKHDLTLELLQRTGPLVMPSANLSGKPSATTIQHVESDFGLQFPVLDGGPCQKGLESTILFYKEKEWVIARLGALPPESFTPILGYQPHLEISSSVPICPGQLFRHYAPQAALILGDQTRLEEASVVIGFQERIYPAHKKVIYWGSHFSPEKIAQNLYDTLRQLDAEGVDCAWIDMDFPREGLWHTIAERLERASKG